VKDQAILSSPTPNARRTISPVSASAVRAAEMPGKKDFVSNNS